MVPFTLVESAAVFQWTPGGGCAWAMGDVAFHVVQWPAALPTLDLAEEWTVRPYALTAAQLQEEPLAAESEVRKRRCARAWVLTEHTGFPCPLNGAYSARPGREHAAFSSLSAEHTTRGCTRSWLCASCARLCTALDSSHAR